MTRVLFFRPQARAELLEARAWYETERSGLGAAFLTEVRTAVALLRQMPEAFPVVHRPVRRLLLKRFPYALYFVVEDDAVIVLALVHGKRDPTIWRSRAEG